MTVCGIVAEYNPFHTGHAHHIAQTQRALGGEAAIVCAMSGNFVQRGDFAVLAKYARAEMASQRRSPRQRALRAAPSAYCGRLAATWCRSARKRRIPH